MTLFRSCTSISPSTSCKHGFFLSTCTGTQARAHRHGHTGTGTQARCGRGHTSAQPHFRDCRNVPARVLRKGVHRTSVHGRQGGTGSGVCVQVATQCRCGGRGQSVARLPGKTRDGCLRIDWSHPHPRTLQRLVSPPRRCCPQPASSTNPVTHTPQSITKATSCN